jgi:hypothetical protein
MRSPRLLTLLAIISSPAFAQSSLPDLCTPIITDGLREYLITSESDSYLNTIFDKYCDLNGSLKNQGGNVGLETVVKSLPIKFTGSYSSSEQAIRNFCRDYANVVSSQRNRNLYQEKIVRRAYDSFDTCITLALTGVIARHKVEGMTRVNFYLAPGFSHPVTVRGVHPTKNLSCKGQYPSDSKEITFGTNSRVKLMNNDVLGMVCTRTGREVSGNTVYDEANVTILTDLNPFGNYTIFMPRDTRIADNAASSIGATIKEFRTQHAADIEAAKKESGRLSMEIDALKRGRVSNVTLDSVKNGSGLLKINGPDAASDCQPNQVAVGLRIGAGNHDIEARCATIKLSK